MPSWKFPARYRVPILENPHRFRALLAILAATYLSLVVANLGTSSPFVDEAAFANPSYNMISEGFSGTTLYDEHGLMPTESLKRHTYWVQPLYLVSNAAFFRVAGFGLWQVRAPSVLWGALALASWYVLIRCGGHSPALSLLVTAFISLGYYFILSSSFGRMDMMCLALGTAGLASYCALRESNLLLAVLVSNTLVVASGLTHAVGIAYFCSLLFMILSNDRKRIQWRHLISASIPYVVGAVAWGSYILEDPAGFREQMAGNLAVTKASADLPDGFAPWASLKQELIRRYLGPFGIGPGVSPVSRAKALILISYIFGLGGLLWTRRLRSDAFLRSMLVVAAINFGVLAFVATSKNHYYLPHTTTVFSAILALFVLRWPQEGSSHQLRAIVFLGGLAALQAAGILAQARANPLQNQYQTTVAVIHEHSRPGNLVFAPAEIWLALEPDRTLVHDWTFGYASGRKAQLIVLSPYLRSLLEQGREVGSPEYEHAAQVLAGYHKIFDNGYYEIFESSL